MTIVHNADKPEEEIVYSLPPEQAVVCAFEQSKDNWNPLNTYDFSQAVEGKFGWTCGPYWAKKES